MHTIALLSVAERNMCGVLRPSMYDAVCVNAAIEINVLDYNVGIRQRTVPYAVRTGFKSCIKTLHLLHCRRKAGNRALASTGFIMQRTPCTLGSRSFADNWSTAWCRPLPITPMT